MVETQAIEKHTGDVAGQPFEQDTIRLAKAMAQSGFFKDSPDIAKAVVKILAGRELGFGPVASMTGIYIVDGKVTLSANLMAAAIKRSGRYNYRVRELTNTTCQIEFFEGKESVGVSGFTIEDATAAGLAGKQTWKQYPRNLLFARAMSNGARFHCADVFGGPTYTPEELGAAVNEDGDPLDSRPSSTNGAAQARSHVDGEYRVEPDAKPPATEQKTDQGEGLPAGEVDPRDALEVFGATDAADEVAAAFEESPVRGACRSVFSKMQRWTMFERVKLPADTAPDSEWNTWHDSWLPKVEEAERAAERRGTAATTQRPTR